MHSNRVPEGPPTQKSGIILFDIDDFKEINDTHGHIAGDKILQYVASILTNVFCEFNYSVYCIGGDEFAVMAENATEKDIIDLLLEVRHYETSNRIYLSKGYSIIVDKESFWDAFSKANEMLYVDKAFRK